MAWKFDSCLEHILNQLWLLRKIKLCTFLGSFFETPMPLKELDQNMVDSNSKNHLLIWSKNGPQPISSLRNCSNISPKSWSSFETSTCLKDWDVMKVIKTRLNTRDDSYYFRIRSSIRGKKQRHRMDFELQILFSIHFLYCKGFQTAT